MKCYGGLGFWLVLGLGSGVVFLYTLRVRVMVRVKLVGLGLGLGPLFGDYESISGNSLDKLRYPII